MKQSLKLLISPSTTDAVNDQIIETQVNALFAGHDLGPFESFSQEPDFSIELIAVCRNCGRAITLSSHFNGPVHVDSSLTAVCDGRFGKS